MLEVQTRITKLLRPLAMRFNITMGAFGRPVLSEKTDTGHLEVSVAFGNQLEPSPVTPTGPEDPYQILAGTIRGAIGDSKRNGGRAVVVVPQIEKGNTGASSSKMPLVCAVCTASRR